MAVAVLLQAALKFLQLWYLRRLKVALLARLSSQFFWHLLQLPTSFYAQGNCTNRLFRIIRTALVLDN